MSHGLLDIEKLRESLHTRRVGRRIELMPSTTSTSDEAWQRVDAEDADGLVVFTEQQTRGRGRHGRFWHSPRGASLMFSLVLREKTGSNSAGQIESESMTGGQLALLTPVAVASAIESTTGVRAAIKWPNDLVVRRRKIGGILIESRRKPDRRPGNGAASPFASTFYVVGVGVNCLQQRGHFPAELENRATSLDLESVEPIDRQVVALHILTELDRWLAPPRSWTDRDLHEAWLVRSDMIGQHVRLRQGEREFSGTVTDVDPSAALLLQLDQGGLRRFPVQDTTLVSDG